MTGFDLVVRNGTLVTPRATYLADVGIRGGRIAAIVAPGELTSQAGQLIDASGLHVLPGVIDGHVHFREPGLEYKEDFGTGSRAAVMGGVTTVLEMPNTIPPTATAELVLHKRRLAETKSYCDFGLYGLVDQDSVEQLAPMAAAGVVGFKCFLGRSTGDIGPPDDGRLLEALGIIAELEMRCAFHAENDEIIQSSIRRLQADGRVDPLAHLESRPVIAELESIQRVGLFAASTRAKAHILHLSSAPGVAAVEDWRRRGVDMTCEVTPHHCFLSSDDYEHVGSLLRINPPVREPGHSAVLLAGVASGAVNAIATDHAPHLLSEKLQENVWNAVSGFAGVETSLKLFLTYGVHAGRLSLQQLVRATSEGPAQLWGLYPRKGALEVGSDADVTLVDLALEDVIDSERLHGKNNPTPFDGWRTRGGPVATVVRGQVVMRDGDLIGPPLGRMVQAVANFLTDPQAAA